MEGPHPTYRLVDEHFLSAVKTNAVIINSSRGGVIDELALLDHLNTDKLASVVLDVWENEPQINQALLSKTIISTPHIAGYSLDAKYQGVRQVSEKIYKLYPADNTIPSPDIALPMADRYLTVTDAMDDNEVIQFAVLSGYDVSKDSDRFKQVSNGQEDYSGKKFADFRKNYPVRREFTNFTVCLPPSRKMCRLQLEGLGFKVTLQENNIS
jgi:erythronate-4-phosphate dehydrogenase